MIFQNQHYLIPVLTASLLIIGIFLFTNRNYIRWIQTYWFYIPSTKGKISRAFYLMAIALFLISLLDWRGHEEKVKANLPDQKTLIILDTSLSMLTEDVKPNRFLKSIQLARHFVKNSPGHQIGIVLFSDIHKRIIPFTDDIDLIDSRLASLEKTNSVYGGSNIAQAILEAANYFITDSNSSAESSSAGNILVFTDGEEGESELKMNLPPEVNLLVIGVGTASGGAIPLRFEDGSFRGHKTDANGQNVVSKLDENYIRSLGKNIKNFKFWIAGSYSLPTEELLNFLRDRYNSKHGKGDMRVRPVKSHLILIPAILLFCLSILFGRFRTFKVKDS